MAQPMWRDSHQTRSESGHLHQMRNRSTRKCPVRSVDPNEDVPVLRRAWAAIPQVCSYRCADILRQRQLLGPIALAPNNELAGTPVDVLEAECTDLTSTQSEPTEQH